MLPIVHGLEDKYKGRVAFFHANVDLEDGRNLAEKMNVESIPRFEFYAQGKMVDEQRGATTSDLLEQKLQKILAR